MKQLRFLFLLLLAFTFIFNVSAQTVSLDNPIPRKAHDLINEGVRLAEQQDKVAEGLAKLKETIAIAPDSVKAHSEYVRIKSYWQDKELEVQAEYEDLMKKEPNNPVYPLALALGQVLALSDVKAKRIEKAAQLLPPDSIWGNYTKARMIENENPELALALYLKLIEKVPTEKNFYDSAFPLLLKQQKFNEYTSLLTKINQQPELKYSALRYDWDFQLAKAGGTDEARKQLIAGLDKIVQDSNDVETLQAIRRRYRPGTDDERIKVLDEKLSRLDPTWYPQRGQIIFDISFSEDANRNFFAGRQNQIHEKLKAISPDIDPQEQISMAEQLLSADLQPSLKSSIYRLLFGVAAKNKDYARAVKYGELLLKGNPKNSLILADLAKIYADQKGNEAKAEKYSQLALDLTIEFRPIIGRPSNIPVRLFNIMMSEDKQREFYNNRRLAVLNARAYVLSASGANKEAKEILQESLKMKPTFEAYDRLEKVLRKLRRIAEAEKAAADGESLWRKETLAGFTNEPMKDFELTNIKGEKIKLSDLKGKIVLINFWATWCVPCVKEMPILAKLYDKYKVQGLEILAVSADQPEDKPKVALFAEKKQIKFPVLYGENAMSLYGVQSYPTTIFIDRAGNIKYRTSGLEDELLERSLEFIISELIKSNS